MIGFGGRLKEERKRLKLSAEKFGDLLGIAGNTQYNYEKEERSPDVIYLAQVSRLGCDVIYIVTGQRAVSTVSDEEFRLLDAFRSASEAVRSAALAALLSGATTRGQVNIRGDVSQFVEGNVTFAAPVQFSTGKVVKEKKKS